jgi:hypothetical protein
VKSRILAIATFVVALTAVLLPASPASASTSGDFLADINGLRASKGLSALSLNGSLSGFAQGWTEQMASAGKISHNPNLGKAPGGWSTIGENVGVGGSEKSIFNALVASSGHYANMVNPKFNSIGIGVTVGGDGRIYTTHNFAAYTSAGNSSSSKPAPTTSKPANNKPATTSAPKSTAPAATKSANAPATTTAPAAPVAPVAPEAPAAPVANAPVAAPALPLPSDRIVQGLAEVGGISTQG